MSRGVDERSISYDKARASPPATKSTPTTENVLSPSRLASAVPRGHGARRIGDHAPSPERAPPCLTRLRKFLRSFPTILSMAHPTGLPALGITATTRPP